VSEKLRKNLIKYGISAAACLAFAGFFAYNRGIAEGSMADVYRILSDAFTVPGLMCVFSGALVWLSGEGALDGVTYVVQYAVKSLLFMGGRGKRETYREYVERRRAKKMGGYGFLLVTGAVSLLVGAVFMVLFYQVK